MRLFAFERRRAELIGRALIPTGSLPAPSDERHLGDALAAQLQVAPWWSALAMRFAFWLVWYAPLTRLKTFGGLTPDQRVEQLERMMASRQYAIRESLTLLKLATCMSALGDVRVLKALGAYRLDAPAATVGLGTGRIDTGAAR